MSSLSLAHFLPLPRCNLTWSYCYASMNVVQLGGLKIQCKSGHVAMARKKASLGSVEEEPSENEPVVEKKVTKASKPKKVSAKTTKKKECTTCFGAAQHAFVPSGRPANRLIDHELHERMKDALWSPEKFVRAPGGCAGSVAIALASLGGKVAFMGKLADDEYGQAMLYYMNANNVQTRSVSIDSKRATGVSLMKIGKRKLKLSCVKPCAEDCLTKSEINIDVLKEAKMFYFNTHSLLDRHMRSTTLQAIKIAKHFGAVVFYDVNLPMPLWHSQEETKTFIQQVWNLADIIEVTKQELEFLCGITPSEEFDTKNNARSKFVHYEPEVVAPLWHENLKVLFVTNGTSKIHYYTTELDGAVSGMEDAPITPFTRDMSASGDGIVAVWADADTWFERQQQEEDMRRLEAENKAAMLAAEELHRKQVAEEREGEKDEIEIKDDPMARAEAEVVAN